MLIIVISGTVIWTKLFRLDRSLMKVGNSFPQCIQDQHKNKTKTLSILLLCAVICNLNVLTIVISVTNLSIFYILNSIYYLQYALNIFVFAGSSLQYRKMYLQGWKKFTCQSKKDVDCNIYSIQKGMFQGDTNDECVLQGVKIY